VYVVIGFESQLDALSGVSVLEHDAGVRGVDIAGAALARRDAEHGLHVEPLRGYALPVHAMTALGNAVDDDCDRLRPGTSALVVEFSPGDRAWVDDAELVGHGASWVMYGTSTAR
jgi:hypothetical protein